MNDLDLTPRQEAPGSDSNTTFLSLFLLVLAFFILLISISSFEKVKAKALMDSLASSFPSVLPVNQPVTFTGQTGEIFNAQQHQEQLADVFATSIQVTKVETVVPGRQMRLLLNADSLFLDDKAEIRPAQYPLLDRVVASLSNRPPGLRFDVEFVVGSEYAGGKSLPIGQTLAMARAGAFAREMRNRGAPPDSVSIGMKAGDPREVAMYFYTRGIDENRVKITGEDPPKKEPAKTEPTKTEPTKTDDVPKATAPLPPLPPSAGTEAAP